MVGSLDTDRMEKALCKAVIFYFVTVSLFLLHFLPVTTFHPSVSSFDTLELSVVAPYADYVS